MLVFWNRRPILWDGLQKMTRCRPERWNMKSSRQFKRQKKPRIIFYISFLRHYVNFS